MTEVERKEDFRPEEFIDWIKDEPVDSEVSSEHKDAEDPYGFKGFFDTLADSLAARAGGEDRDLIEDLEEARKKKAAEEAAKKAAAKRAESGIGDIFGADDDDERKRGIAFKSPFAEMSDEELEEALKKANKNTYWEFGLHTEKKRRAGKTESFIYEKEGTRIPVLPTYTNKMEREICGEPVAVSFGDLPRTKNVNSIGNPNAVRYTTHLEIHFDITEGAETKEGKSAAYMKAQSFLAAAYRGDTLGGKPVRKFRLTNMSEEELKAWGEVRAAFEGQGKKIEFILTDEQQKVFDRYAAKFAEITRLNRELVGGVKEEEKTAGAEVAEKASEKVASETTVEPTEASKDAVAEDKETMEESKTVVEPTEIIEPPAPEVEDVPAEEKTIIDVKAVEKTDTESATEADSASTEADVYVSAEDLRKEAAELREKLEALKSGAIPVGPVTEEDKATTATEDAPEFVNLPDVSAFFKRMDKEGLATMKSAWPDLAAFFKRMNRGELAAMKNSSYDFGALFKMMNELAEQASNSGVSSVVKEKAPKEEILYDLSTSQGRVDARDAVISRIRTNLKTAYTTRAKGKWAIVEEEAREDLAKYADWHCEKTEEVVAKAEGLRTASDILEEVKRKVGESRFANKRAMDAYNRERNRKGIEQCLRSWEQCKEHEGR